MAPASWFLRPNWSDSVKVTYEYKTNIISSRAVNEQRRALRGTPRRTIEYKASSLREADTAYFHRFSAGYQPGAVYVPEYPAHIRAVGEIDMTTGSFIADRDIPSWLIEGMNVMVFVPDYTWNTTIFGVTPSTRSVTVGNGATPVQFPNGTRICALRRCYFPDTIALSRPTYRHAESTIQFQVEPASEEPSTPVDPLFVFEGTEVFLEKPDFGMDVSEELRWAVETVDAGWGVTRRYVPTPRQVRALRATYWKRGTASTFALIDFFTRMRGMRGEFLMPTWERDVFPGYDIAAGQTYIREVGTFLNDAWVRGWPYAVIMIALKNGTRNFRRVTEVHAVTDGDGTDSIATLDVALDDAITLDQIDRVSWVPTWRFSTDTLTVDWRTDEVGITALSMQTLESIQGDNTAPVDPPPSTGIRVTFIDAGATSWQVPIDLDPSVPAKVELLAAGMGGGAGMVGAFLAGIAGLGGAGAGYSVIPAIFLNPGDHIPVSVSHGGAGSRTPGGYAGVTGGNSRFGIGLGEGGADQGFAEGGHLHESGSYAEGGRASLAIPLLNARSGGNGGTNSVDFLAGPGGGGAGGPHGDGADGAPSTVGGGGSGGGAADGGADAPAPIGDGTGGQGGTAFDASAGGTEGSAGLHGSGAGGGHGGGDPTRPGGIGGYGVGWHRSSDGRVAGPGGGGGGGGGGTGATDGSDGGAGGQYGGGGGAGGCAVDTTGLGADGGDGIIAVTYTSRVI